MAEYYVLSLAMELGQHLTHFAANHVITDAVNFLVNHMHIAIPNADPSNPAVGFVSWVLQHMVSKAVTDKVLAPKLDPAVQDGIERAGVRLQQLVREASGTVGQVTQQLKAELEKARQQGKFDDKVRFHWHTS